LRIDLFHRSISYHIAIKSLNRAKLTSPKRENKVTAMRIAVMGSGAVGGYFGAKLAAAGHELIFIARGHHLEVMRQRGLRIDSPNGNLQIERAAFTDSRDELNAVDLVLFCVKSYDTQTAAQALAPLIGDGTMILSLQNGVDNADKLASFWGEQRIFAGVVYIAAQLESPGVIQHSNGGKIILGQLDGAIGAAAELIEQILSGAGIPCALSTNIRTVQWAKLLWNAPFCAISCLTGANVAQIIESEALTQLAAECMAEVQAAARTRGVELSRILFDETIAFSRGLGVFKPSMLQDFEARKPLEYEAFNGVVFKLLRHAGEAAPINQSFYALLQQLDKKNRQEAARKP
jgi:2-dehydropantoate 2-reductase